MTDNVINDAIEFYKEDKGVKFELDSFLAQVTVFFDKNPILNEQPFPIVHSMKSRFKDPEHLRDKLIRKKDNGIIISSENIVEEINDLIGCRILYLYQDQFRLIHDEIMRKIDEVGDWKLVEEPKAYTWDPESKMVFKEIGIKTELRETYYTSVHYVVKPNANVGKVSCEIQVRTLFEEIWGEIDHSINYPHQTKSIACQEQLRVLSKLVSTGTRLADSIFRSYVEYEKKDSQ